MKKIIRLLPLTLIVLSTAFAGSTNYEEVQVLFKTGEPLGIETRSKVAYLGRCYSSSGQTMGAASVIEPLTCPKDGLIETPCADGHAKYASLLDNKFEDAFDHFYSVRLFVDPLIERQLNSSIIRQHYKLEDNSSTITYNTGVKIFLRKNKTLLIEHSQNKLQNFEDLYCIYTESE